MPNCKQCKSPFEVTKEDLEFYDKVSPVFSGKKFLIPPPTLCPDCRAQHRLAFRNHSNIYNQKSSLSGRPIISIFSPDKPFKVYDRAEWWGDQWDPLSYGRDFDPNRPFFEQFRELSFDVPHQALFVTNVENSDYTNHGLNLRNCYLVFGAADDEDCLYGKFVIGCRNVVDAFSVYATEESYEGVSSEGCYQCHYFFNSKNCSDCLMVDECQSCKNCIACFGLANKECCYRNEYVGKEKIEELRKELYPLTHSRVEKLKGELARLQIALPHRYAQIFASENCTGDMVMNSRNCLNCYDVKNSEDCNNIANSPNSRNSQDANYTAPNGVELCYNVNSTLGRECIGTFLAWHCDHVYYSMECHNCSHCLGCYGLKRKQYCILNKQYSKEEYEKKAAEIAGSLNRSGEWGGYFPKTNSAFGYNESVAQEYFPLSKSEALKKGFTWSDYEAPSTKASRVITADLMGKLPENIKETPDDIVNWALTCEATGKLFKIIPQELEFYRKHRLPVPHLHPDERHRQRMALRNPRHLWSRTCAKCGTAIQTTYSPERPETVYCEECYLKEVY